VNRRGSVGVGRVIVAVTSTHPWVGGARQARGRRDGASDTDEGEAYDEEEPYEEEGEDAEHDDDYADKDEAGVVRQTRSAPA
jgi:hypothetical protein